MNDIFLMFLYIGCCCTLFIYHLLIYIGRQSDKSNLSFALFNSSVAFMIFGSRIYPALTIPNNTVSYILRFLATIYAVISLQFFMYTIINLTKFKLFYIFASIIVIISSVEVDSFLSLE